MSETRRGGRGTPRLTFALLTRKTGGGQGRHRAERAEHVVSQLQGETLLECLVNRQLRGELSVVKVVGSVAQGAVARSSLLSTPHGWCTAISCCSNGGMTCAAQSALCAAYVSFVSSLGKQDFVAGPRLSAPLLDERGVIARAARTGEGAPERRSRASW